MSRTVSYSYMTPSVARMAYEQITAWYVAKCEKEAAEHGGTADTGTIPETITAQHWDFLGSRLQSAGIDPELLEKAGLATIERETVHNCGMTNYSRDEYTYTVNMRGLYELALQPLQPPGPAPTARAAANRKVSTRFKV